MTKKREPAASPQATRTPDDRTPQDYAIEFGEYLAEAAERFLEQSNLYDKSEAEGTEPDYDTLSDCWRGLQSAIGDFRKRAKRAAQPAAGTTVDQQFAGKCITDPQKQEYLAQAQTLNATTFGDAGEG